jgi:hypothetical protein
MPKRVKKQKPKRKPAKKPESKAGLAKKLGITPQALNWHLKNSHGTPAVGDVKAWIEFLAQNGREGSAPEDVRRKIADKRYEILEQDLIDARRRNDEAAGRMLDAGAVASAIRDAVATMFAELDRIFLTEQPPAVKGLDEVKIRQKNTQYIAELKAVVIEKFDKASKPQKRTE